jgi:hypothetical protein
VRKVIGINAGSLCVIWQTLKIKVLRLYNDCDCVERIIVAVLRVGKDILPCVSLPLLMLVKDNICVHLAGIHRTSCDQYVCLLWVSYKRFCLHYSVTIIYNWWVWIHHSPLVQHTSYSTVHYFPAVPSQARQPCPLPRFTEPTFATPTLVVTLTLAARLAHTSHWMSLQVQVTLQLTVSQPVSKGFMTRLYLVTGLIVTFLCLVGRPYWRRGGLNVTGQLLSCAIPALTAITVIPPATGAIEKNRECEGRY